jgi:hypothetical protein
VLARRSDNEVYDELAGVKLAMEDTTDFKIQFREECRFDPGHPHHLLFR